jgi:predicted transposase/invertase (TIGR01784 family)
MGPDEISNPHDRFFKEVFSREEVGRDFVLRHLPADIASLLDTDSLTLTKGSFVDKELREHFSDMAYKVRLRSGGEAYIYVLLEHKSYADPMTGFQVLRYKVRIWERLLRAYRKQRKKERKQPFRLPPVIPMVVYHGKDKWEVSLSFQDMFDMPEELTPFVPDFRYLLCDISHIPDEEIRGMVFLRVGMLVMKYVFRDDLAERLPGILRLMGKLSGTTSISEFLETVVRYLCLGTDKITEQDMGKAIRTAFPDTGGDLMATLAEKWFQQGERKGERKGLLRGIELGLKLKFGHDGLKILPEIRRITDTKLLATVHDRLRTADTPDALRRIYKTG